MTGEEEKRSDDGPDGRRCTNNNDELKQWQQHGSGVGFKLQRRGTSIKFKQQWRRSTGSSGEGTGSGRVDNKRKT